MSPELFAWHYMESIVRLILTISLLLLDAKMWLRHFEAPYDIRKFTADAILFREIKCKKKDILMLKQHFECDFGWGLVK